MIAGIDGAPGGWIVAESDGAEPPRLYRIDTLAPIIRRLDHYTAVALDMPVGLPNRAEPGGRLCDREARRLLGKGRGSSVFSPPALATLAADEYHEACRINANTGHNVKLSRQSFGLFPKLREVVALIGVAEQRVIHEVHPELAFMTMAGAPVMPSKKRDEGVALRKRLLTEAGIAGVEELVQRRREFACATDDILDALACLWSAARIAEGSARRLPADPPINDAGLRMEILY